MEPVPRLRRPVAPRTGVAGACRVGRGRGSGLGEEESGEGEGESVMEKDEEDGHLGLGEREVERLLD